MKKYTGKLSVPLASFEHSLFQETGFISSKYDEVAARLLEERNKEFGERILLLFDHYELPRLVSNLPMLACKLAQAHVPGFREASGATKGRKLIGTKAFRY